MPETTTTSLAVNQPTEFIAADIVEEARPNIVIANLVQKPIMPEYSGTNWEHTQLPVTSSSGLTEGTDMTAGTRTTVRNADITVAENGLRTDVTDLAGRTSRSGAADLSTWSGSAGRAIAQQIDGDLAALFPGLNSSTAVGTSGAALSVANFITAIYTLENNNAPYPYVSVLHPIQKFDLFSALASTSNAGALHTNIAELIREGRLPNGTPANGFWGELFGVPIYVTTEVDTANSAADRAGAMFNRLAMAFVQLAPVSVELERDASNRATEINAVTTYGVGEDCEDYGVPIITDAT